MAEAVFKHGDPRFIDYTAAATIAAGEVVILGNTTGLTCGVAHLDIANAGFGALAAGGGIYDCTSLENAVVGTKVYWDNSTNKVTTTSTNNATFGFVVETGTGANTVVEVLHEPYV